MSGRQIILVVGPTTSSAPTSAALAELGLTASQRFAELTAGMPLSAEQQVVQALMGSMDEVHEALGLDGRDLTGFVGPALRLRSEPYTRVRRRAARRSGADEFIVGPTHRNSMTLLGGDLEESGGVERLTPEAILIAQEGYEPAPRVNEAVAPDVAAVQAELAARLAEVRQRASDARYVRDRRSYDARRNVRTYVAA
ncbi:MAG: hypothetical protein Q7T01_02930 [bacterium]|nr:hypothetical protein [bacterium]